MTFMLLVLTLVAVLLLAALALATFVRLVEDRRRLDILTERLSTENRIEHLSRATLQAMRDATRQPEG